MFKYLCLRFSFGHLSSVGERLKETYGKKIFDTAACMAIEHELNMVPLMMDGILFPGAYMYGFPEGKDTEWYCQALRERDEARKMEQGKGLSSLLDLMKALAGAGVGPADGDTATQMQELFGDQFDPAAFQAPEGTPDASATVAKQKEDAVALDATSSNWMLNEPPEWIRNGQVDEDLLAKEVQNGAVDILPFCDTFMGLPPEIADLVAKKVLLDATNHTNMKTQGWFSGEAEQFIEYLLRDPVVGWIVLLRSRERTHISREREPTRRRISRRHPTYWGRRSGKQCLVYAFIDTSGSMGERELACVSAELHGLARRGSTVYVGQVDADLQRSPELFDGRTNLERFFGRGGTDFRPAFDWMAQQVTKPDFVVYFTDGAGTAPSQPPKFMNELDILWVLTDEGMSPDDFREHVCKYGDIVVMDTVKDVDDNRFNNKDSA